MVVASKKIYFIPRGVAMFLSLGDMKCVLPVEGTQKISVPPVEGAQNFVCPGGEDRKFVCPPVEVHKDILFSRACFFYQKFL